MAACGVKLEVCEVCGKTKARYTCPKCEVRTCTLDCVKIHKKELECDGIRDKTKFLPMKEFTDLDVLSDYRLLEEVGRSVDSFKRDPSKKYTREQGNLPVHLHKLKSAVNQRNTRLEYLPQNFTKHRENTTYYKWKTNELFWRIEWIFPNAENLKHVDDRVLETERLSTVIERVLDPLGTPSVENESIETINLKIMRNDRLQYYRSAGIGNIKVLLKAERVKKCDSRFHELDLSETLRYNFENKLIIEYPVLYVIMKDHSDIYDIIDSSDEIEEKEDEEDEESRAPEFGFGRGRGRGRFRGNLKRKYKNNEKDEKIYNNSNNNKDKDTPVNYFFNTDDLSDDSDNETMQIDQYNGK